MQTSTHLAEQGLKKIKLDSERKAWLLSFQCPRLTVKDVSQICKMNITTARKALNASHNPFRKGRSDDKDRNPYGSRSGKSVYGDAKRSSYGRKDNGRFAKRFSKNDR